MTTGILVFHIILAAIMIGIILLQRNEGGALGMGGGNSSGGFMTSRGAANLLTRTTAVLATSFFVTTIVLALMIKGEHKPKSILDEDDSLETIAPAAINESDPVAPNATPLPLVSDPVHLNTVPVTDKVTTNVSPVTGSPEKTAVVPVKNSASGHEKVSEKTKAPQH